MPAVNSRFVHGLAGESIACLVNRANRGYSRGGEICEPVVGPIYPDLDVLLILLLQVKQTISRFFGNRGESF